METLLSKLMFAMITQYAGDPKRIQHFVKVHSFATMIGEQELQDQKTLQTLQAAAIVHDIGIHLSEQKYGSCSGQYQEIEGPALAESLLSTIGFPADVIARVCYLVGHHHTYHDVDGLDYQILLEADFLVNLFEEQSSAQAIASARQRIFKTQTGLRLCDSLFPID